MQLADIGEVLEQYNLSRELEPTPLAGGTANQNYEIRSGEDRFVLRIRNDNYSSLSWLTFEEEFLQFIYDRGLPVPLPIRNVSDQSWTIHRDKVCQLSRFIPGTKFTDKATEVYEAGAFLGSLHQAAAGFAAKNPKPLPRYDDPAVTLQAFIEAEKQFKDRIEPGQQAVVDYLKHQCAEIIRHVPDDAYWSLPGVVIHGDYHPGNISYSDGKVSGVFDFDWASVQPRVRDIVDGIAYFAARRKQLIDGGDIYSLTQSCRMDMERSVLFVKAYRTSNHDSLSRQELGAIPFLTASRLITSRVLALRKIPEERKLAMLTEGIVEQIRWLEKYREEFVRALAND